MHWMSYEFPDWKRGVHGGKQVRRRVFPAPKESGSWLTLMACPGPQADTASCPALLQHTSKTYGFLSASPEAGNVWTIPRCKGHASPAGILYSGGAGRLP